MLPEPLALVEAVDLEHQAIDFEVEFVQPLDQLFAVRDRRVEVGKHSTCGVGGRP